MGYPQCKNAIWLPTTVQQVEIDAQTCTAVSNIIFLFISCNYLFALINTISFSAHLIRLWCVLNSTQALTLRFILILIAVVLVGVIPILWSFWAFVHWYRSHGTKITLSQITREQQTNREILLVTHQDRKALLLLQIAHVPLAWVLLLQFRLPELKPSIVQQLPVILELYPVLVTEIQDHQLHQRPPQLTNQMLHHSRISVNPCLCHRGLKTTGN